MARRVCIHPHPIERYQNGQCAQCQREVRGSKRRSKSCDHPHPLERNKKGECRQCQRERTGSVKWVPCPHGKRVCDCLECRCLNKRKNRGIKDAHRVNEVLILQGGVCSICKTTNWGKWGANADHDHATGLLRGVLCNNCNSGIGKLRDSLSLVAAAFEYLLDPPAQRRILAEDKRKIRAAMDRALASPKNQHVLAELAKGEVPE